MPIVSASVLDRLPAHTRVPAQLALSRTFRGVGPSASFLSGNRAARDAAARIGVIITEVNIKNAVNHTIEIKQTPGSGWALVGAVGTPNAGVATGNWDEIDFAAAVPSLTIVGSWANPPASGQRLVAVP